MVKCPPSNIQKLSDIPDRRPSEGRGFSTTKTNGHETIEMKNHQVSVIVPAYNAASSIRPCLKSLMIQEIPAYEVIVVNDASVDNTAEIVCAMGIRLVDRKNNGGAGAARAEGAKNATGDILAFADSDCIVPRDWIRQIIEAFE